MRRRRTLRSHQSSGSKDSAFESNFVESKCAAYALLSAQVALRSDDCSSALTVWRTVRLLPSSSSGRRRKTSWTCPMWSSPDQSSPQSLSRPPDHRTKSNTSALCRLGQEPWRPSGTSTSPQSSASAPPLSMLASHPSCEARGPVVLAGDPVKKQHWIFAGGQRQACPTEKWTELAAFRLTRSATSTTDMEYSRLCVHSSLGNLLLRL